VQKNNSYTIKEATERIQSYCSVQERCQWDIKIKMKKWNLSEEMSENILKNLILEDFVNEERFAASFCRGKFKTKKWGKIKIINELNIRKISENFIEKGLLQIDNEEYLKLLKNLYIKKNSSLKDTNQFIRKGKIAKYLQQKGFEIELIWEVINKDK
tara:strand:+ start:240 stop:710 length:471 start_codon:yes stop_codon:yes gene_type:complete